MKYLKMLGIAAIAAAGFMAFVGAGSASATVLCTATDTPDCEASHVYKTGTVVKASLAPGGTARLTSGSSTIATCTGGNVSGKTGNESGAEIEGAIEELTWSGCSQTTHTVTKGSMTIKWISGTHNGTVFAHDSEVTVQIFGVSCTYGAGEETHLGTLTGGATPHLTVATTVKKTAGGFLCPGEAGWDATYVVTEPHALFVTT